MYKIKFLCLLLFITVGCERQHAAISGNQNPQRIISLAPAITEEIYLLNCDEKLVGVTTYCPEESKNKPKIGTVLEPNIERIVTLKPDLILAAGISSPSKTEKLKQLGINVFVFPTEKKFADLEKNFILLSELVNRKQKATEIIEKIKKEIAVIKTKSGKLNKPRVFCQIGANPMVTFGTETFINEMVETAGGINIAGKDGNGYFRYSREKVLNENPEIIILITMGNYTESELNLWQKYKNLTAVKKNRIYIISADDVCRPTPTAFIKGLKKINAILHNE